MKTVQMSTQTRDYFFQFFSLNASDSSTRRINDDGATLRASHNRKSTVSVGDVAVHCTNRLFCSAQREACCVLAVLGGDGW